RRDGIASRQSHDLITPAVKERVGCDEKRASALLNKREGRLKIAVGGRICNDKSNIETRGCRFHLFELSSSYWVGRVDENANSVNVREQLAQEPNSLRPETRSKKNNPRHVASWSMEAGDVAERDRIGTGRKHDWDCCGRRPGGEDGRVAARSCEHRDLALKEFGHERRQAIVLTIRKAINNPNILALDITRFSQSGLKSCHHVGRPTARTALEETDHRHRRLLRVRRERPCSRSASEQRDEFAALHLRGHSITSSARASSVGGISRSNALAVWRLMTSSILVDCMTGRSAGLAPLR